jgi:hypothetical protein
MDLSTIARWVILAGVVIIIIGIGNLNHPEPAANLSAQYLAPFP